MRTKSSEGGGGIALFFFEKGKEKVQNET